MTWGGLSTFTSRSMQHGHAMLKAGTFFDRNVGATA
jgi:hypothetical protein